MDAVAETVARGRGMLENEITFTLNSPITDEQFDMLTDVDMENTPRIVFHTKNGKEVEYLKVVRCKDCKWGKEACGNIECFVDMNAPSEYHGYGWFCPNGERRSE